MMLQVEESGSGVQRGSSDAPAAFGKREAQYLCPAWAVGQMGGRLSWEDRAGPVKCSSVVRGDQR